MAERITLRTIWFDRRGRGFLLQLIVLLLVAVFFAAITSNTIANLQKAGLTSGFGFLGDQALKSLVLQLGGCTTDVANEEQAIVAPLGMHARDESIEALDLRGKTLGH